MRFTFETGLHVNPVSSASFILLKMKQFTLVWFFLILCTVASAAGATVFPQRGIDGLPVRFEKRQIVLQVTRPQKNSLSIGAQRLFNLAKEAADIFTGQLGIDLVIQKNEGRVAHPQEDGMIEIALVTYPPCGKRDGMDTSTCNNENRYGHTRIYPARAVNGRQYREIVEVDIELNAGAFTSFSGKELDNAIVAVLRHEMGHLLGLAHNCVESAFYASEYPGTPKPPVCDDQNPDYTNALMYPLSVGETYHAIAPDAAEWRFLKSMYPIIKTTKSGVHLSCSVIVWVILGVVCIAVIFVIRKYWRGLGGDGC